MKKSLWMVLLFLMIASIALAATASLSIKSSQPLDNQFKAFRAYLDKLSQAEREAWLMELAAIQAEQEAAPFPAWACGAPSGKQRRHGLAAQVRQEISQPRRLLQHENPRQVTREEAISKGFEPRKKCKP